MNESDPGHTPPPPPPPPPPPATNPGLSTAGVWIAAVVISLVIALFVLAANGQFTITP